MKKFCSYLKKVSFHINQSLLSYEKDLLTYAKKTTADSHSKFLWQILAASSQNNFPWPVSLANSHGKSSINTECNVEDFLCRRVTMRV